MASLNPSLLCTYLQTGAFGKHAKIGGDMHNQLKAGEYHGSTLEKEGKNGTYGWFESLMK
jgi:hypothetical protein